MIEGLLFIKQSVRCDLIVCYVISGALVNVHYLFGRHKAVTICSCLIFVFVFAFKPSKSEVQLCCKFIKLCVMLLGVLRSNLDSDELGVASCNFLVSHS